MLDDLKNSELLVKYGFIKGSKKGEYELDEKKGIFVRKAIKEEEQAIDGSHAHEEEDEEFNLSHNNRYYKTGYPKPEWRVKLVYEAFNMSLEELYFWSTNHIKQDAGFPKMVKITDVFSASENSAFFGQSAQRLSIQEDRASNFLRTIGEMVKTLFQIVRELRMIDERLKPYTDWKKSKSADSTLKGFFSDFAENKGGQIQPGSIFHLANQVGYASLPDLFFNTTVYDTNKIDGIVDGMSFNKNVKQVLKRKLYQFIVWKEKTEAELEGRRKFQIKYLRQHYTVIKTYIGWVKPYLKHIKRLQMNEEQLDSPELVSSFETSSTQIEVIAYKPVPKKPINSVVLMNFYFRTRPVMQYSQDYQRGPVHIGRGEMVLRSYAWTDEQIQMYKKMRDDEDRELLGLVDDQLKSAMEMLGEDLDNYIKEAEGTLPSEPEPQKGKKDKKKFKLIQNEGSVFDPFVGIFKGFAEIGSTLIPTQFKGFGKSPEKPKASPGDIKRAIGSANVAMWLVYNNYKKAHGLLSW